MTRVCFRLQVDPARLDEYRARHLAVWPEMLREIEAAGRRNYSLFLAPDGLLIGYYEVDSIVEADLYLAESEIAAAWEKHMGEVFRAPDGDGALDGRADQQAQELDEVFHLDDQLRQITAHQGEPA